jgi:hypothetical protein
MLDITAKATKLIDGGKTALMATLVKQLNRTQCKLALPAPTTKSLSRPQKTVLDGLAPRRC